MANFTSFYGKIFLIEKSPIFKFIKLNLPGLKFIYYGVGKELV